jgi:hypothetical protein
VVLKVRDRYLSIINPGIYTYLTVTKNQRTDINIYPWFLKKSEKSKNGAKELPGLYLLFHENCGFFEVFEIIMTVSSLTLNVFQRMRTDSSLILQYLKN